MVRYFWLGLIQGLTEFLPVSSSGHLLLAGWWLKVAEPGALFVAFAHLGTIFALLIWFRKDLGKLLKGLIGGERESLRYLGFLAVGTFPLVVAAIPLKGWLDSVFTPQNVPFMLVLNGLLLLVAGRRTKRAKKGQPGFLEALVVGLAQMLSILPGLSRSGLTISAGLRAGLAEDEAFRFSFFLGIPAILGALLFALFESGEGGWNWAGLGITAATAFSAGLLALFVLFKATRRRVLWPFGLYCLLLGALSWALR